jgi:cytochrome c556
MPRKYAVLSASMLGVALTVGGLSLAADETPLEKQMSTINAKHRAIKKATQTIPAWKKDSKNVVKHAEEIVKYGKEARADKGPAEKQKKTFDEWTKLMDEMIKSSQELAVLAKADDTTQPVAKKAFQSLDKTCAACHTVFRVDEEK